MKFNVLEQPDKVSYPSIAFKVAAWFWRENAYVIKSKSPAAKANLNELADGTFLRFTHLTHSLTTNVNSVVARVQINDMVLKEFRLALKRGQGVTCETSMGGYAVPICTANFQRPYCGCEGIIDFDSCPYGRLANGLCRNSDLIKCCIESCDVDLDLVILVDGSGSVGLANFNKVKKFVKAVVNKLDVSEFESRVAIVQFDTQAYDLIDFSNVTTSNILINDVINSMKFNGGKNVDAHSFHNG